MQCFAKIFISVNMTDVTVSSMFEIVPYFLHATQLMWNKTQLNKPDLSLFLWYTFSEPHNSNDF